MDIEHKLQEEDAAYSLQQYRNDRVKVNARRVAFERSAAGADYAAPDSTSKEENPRRRAVLRETSMPSAFEHVNYNMPETVPQEVVARRQIARDMADAGIHSDGPRVSDIIHQPPRHAMLTMPTARMRTSRELLLAQDRAVASGEADVRPLPRPYLPSAIINAEGEPQRYHRKVDARKAAFSEDVKGQRPTLREESRALQEILGVPHPGGGPQRYSVFEVQKAADILRESMQSLANSRDILITTLLELSRNFWPTERILNATGVGLAVNRLRYHPEKEVADIATRLDHEFRTAVRVEQSMSTLASATKLDGEDPFVDIGSDLFGQKIAPHALDRAIRRRQEAAQDYNRDVTRAIRERVQYEEKDLTRQLEAEEDEDVRLVQTQATAYATVKPIIQPSTSNSGFLQKIRQATSAVAAILSSGKGAKGSSQDSDATITDPDLASVGNNAYATGLDADDADGDEDLADNDGEDHSEDAEDEMPTGNQNFEIFEVDPSPERPQREQSVASPGQENRDPDDNPPRSVDSEQISGLCHPCPDFPGTYHHTCAPPNPRCVTLLAKTPSQTTPLTAASGSSHEPETRPTRPSTTRTPDRGITRLASRSPQSIRSGRMDESNLLTMEQGVITQAKLDRDTVDLAVPVTRPASIGEHMADPFISNMVTMNPFARILKGGQRSSISGGGRSSTSPSSLTSGGQRTRAEYMEKTHEELAAELRERDHSPNTSERGSKDMMIRLLMGFDVVDLRGTSNVRSTGNAETVSPLDLNFPAPFEPAVKLPDSVPSMHSPCSSRAARSSGRSTSGTGSKRASPTANDDEPVAKRLRWPRKTKSA